MSNNIDLKKAISQRIQAFASQRLRQSALALFAALGYTSDRTVEMRSVQDFREQFDPENLLSNPAAQIEQWQNAELLFQLTDEELSSSAALFKDDSVHTSLLQSYVFIAIELREGDYARGKLANIARQLNRVFPMPVMVLFKVGGLLSLAVINRRLNKRDENKDVLGKVTLIQNIGIAKPHPGHLDILASFSLAEFSAEKRSIQNFDQLHAAWEEVFNVELLNKRFYRELANWYFWALPQVDFPTDIEKDDEKRRATGLIRLLTRLIFCWFLKEKSLIPEKLFVETDLKNILKDLSPDASTYNEAILQNLFFATLNQRMGKDAKGLPFRAFARDEGFQKNRVTYGVDTLYRYEEHFHDPDTALDHFADVPFLNGGLFECLDRIEEATNKKHYLDGFSRNAKKRPTIPNRLFFGSEREEDLSGAYGDTKRKKEKVRGLLCILHAYKFTIVENTPVDQEIALDPELLGKVFENLLASYNEETKTTARKQTGSFYTPRPIVEYMVDESLKAHLTGALAKAGLSEQDAQAGLDILFTYTERAHPFSEQEVATLLDAIHTCKILDPACGSGAFPMGMLHKLVYIIHKLDPDNARWKQLQIDAAAKIPDLSSRDAAIDAIERDFADNEDDYGRKLYLIENCLYGVDIQPIAIQISKLRFFISLVCDQRTNRNKRDNHGIRPLPNLETKFVAADTLIRLPEMNQLALLPHRVHQIEAEIEALYHSHFAIQRRDQKLALQKKIKGLREDLGKLLAESLGSSKKAQHIADWDPFNPQSVADFFDPHWMFGRSLADGFDIVIGNPPYGIKYSKHQKNTLAALFSKGAEIADSYVYFILKSLDLLRNLGSLVFITPNTFCDLEKGEAFRKHLLTETTIFSIWQSGWVFSAAVVDTLVIHLSSRQPKPENKISILTDKNSESRSQAMFLGMALSKIDFRTPADRLALRDAIRQRTVELSQFFTVKAGVKLYELGKGEPPQTREIVDSKPYTAIGRKEADWSVLCRGGDIDRYKFIDRGEYVHYGHWLAAPRAAEMFSLPKILMRRTDDRLRSTLDKSGSVAVNSCHVIQLKGNHDNDEQRYLSTLALLNSSVCQWAFETDNPQMVGKTFSEIKVVYVERLPIPKLGSTEMKLLASLAHSLILLKGGATGDTTDSTEITFLEDLVDACVMECYFRDHMAERDLLFLDELAPHLADYNPEAPESQQREFIVQLHGRLNAPSSRIRNRLLRISADSPDLLAVIKKGGGA
ncbi:MAG: TaqI-like C-terminal specificity domain-containing protein [Sulfuritalea sp.]|nr:TaqI-like C-terminal specificity domain-containing protein [Sulfuritalea sp.]